MYGWLFAGDQPITSAGTSPPTRRDWSFGIGLDKVIVVEENFVGIRSEYNGILLLGSVLQGQVKSSKDIVQIELNKSEVNNKIRNTLMLHNTRTSDGGYSFVKSIVSINIVCITGGKFVPFTLSIGDKRRRNIFCT